MPVVACIGATRDGELLNVNADTLASHLAAALRRHAAGDRGRHVGRARRAGPDDRATDDAGAAQLIRTGTANKGMVAKLEACRAALRKGVGDVVIANGRDVRFGTLAEAAGAAAGCTQVVR